MPAINKVVGLNGQHIQLALAVNNLQITGKPACTISNPMGNLHVKQFLFSNCLQILQAEFKRAGFEFFVDGMD